MGDLICLSGKLKDGRRQASQEWGRGSKNACATCNIEITPVLPGNFVSQVSPARCFSDVD
jgi:hypothetical protein